MTFSSAVIKRLWVAQTHPAYAELHFTVEKILEKSAKSEPGWPSP